MNVVITIEHRFLKTPDGAIWTPVFSYRFWQRYLEVFDHVNVVARVGNVETMPPGCQRADGEGVSFVAIPYYIGPWQYLQKLRQIRQVIKAAVEESDAVILRVSSQIATDVVPLLRATGHPYGVEVVADPYYVFAPGCTRHPLRPFFRRWFTEQLKQQCANACAAAYVTQNALQKRYPCASYSVGVSDIELKEEAFVATARSIPQKQRKSTLICVGSLAQLYKAPDILIEAVGICARQGLDVNLSWIGDGKYRPELEAQVARLNLTDRICFLGQLASGATIRNHLDQADLFVLPSRTEGLPRAMLEAMARAMPCLGSTTGGIPELLPAEDLVPPNDAAALARKICEVVTDSDRMAAMSRRNLQKAKEYKDEILQEHRLFFYRYVKERTGAWLDSKNGSARKPMQEKL